ncbi:MAG: hypothetical protein GTO02_04830, partial [Candidatus Dadabacteria bacterium]|nr:hypothetical protein [Candidatus Dadabacteria bacterium]NIQ13737.1 hypothetical protein [Candidatus Dadabacteria bacterium]
YILTVFLVFFFLRSCTKSGSVRKAEKVIVEKEVVIDSLENVIELRDQKIDSFPEILRQEKLNIHMDYDNYISEKDR